MQHAVPGPGSHLPQPWLRVGDADRDDVVRLLQQAYAEARIDHGEFDTRVGQALAARTHGDLRAALRGLVPPARPAPPPVARPVTGGERFAALAVHWSGYLTSFIVPLVVVLAERDRSSYLRAQAAEAANFQLTFLLANAAVGIASVLVLPLLLFPVIWVGWLVLTLVGGVAAAGDAGFRYPFTLRLLR